MKIKNGWTEIWQNISFYDAWRKEKRIRGARLQQYLLEYTEVHPYVFAYDCYWGL